MDEEREPINCRDNYPSRPFYDSSRCILKPSVRRQTRHAASDVGFRIPETEYFRKKRRTKPQHCPSCLSQSIHNNSMDSRVNDQHRRKNPEKLEESLTQQMDYATSKMSRSHGENRSLQQQANPLSPRALSGHQRSQYHRPGTSRNRNNSSNTMMAHRPVRKHGNIEPCECTRLDSPHRNIVNSDDPMEDIDFQLPCEHMHSKNISRDSDLYWHFPPGEPHSEPELDSPPQDRHRDYNESKKRHTGQGESSYENCRALESKVSIETGSSVHKDVRDQYERDQRVLKDLYEDVGQFEKRKSAGWIIDDEEKYTWPRPKQQPEEDDEETNDSQYLLESINQFVGKLPVQRKENNNRVVSTKGPKSQTNTQKEQSRAQSSKLDTRKTYYSVGMDGRTGGSGDQHPLEVGRNFDDKLVADIHPESLKREGKKKEEEETQELESLSETEEEARELAREDVETKQIQRQLTKSWDLCKQYNSPWNSRISAKRERNTRDSTADKEEKIYGKSDCGKKPDNDPRERTKGRRKKEVMICEESEPLRPKHFGTNQTEDKNTKRTNTRERSRGNEEMPDKIYEEFKNCCAVSVPHGTGDLQLETSKTRTCIDQIIDSGLSREAKRGYCGTLRETVKDLPCEPDGLEAIPLRRGASDELNKNIRPDGSSQILKSDDHVRISRGDCFCKTLAEIVTEYQGPQEYMKTLKNFRLTYLNHMQSDLEKLYSLEKYLDSISLDKRPSSATLTCFSPEQTNDPKNVSDKRDKAKGSGTQSRT